MAFKVLQELKEVREGMKSAGRAAADAKRAAAVTRRGMSAAH